MTCVECQQCRRDVADLKDFVTVCFKTLLNRFDSQNGQFSRQSKRLDEIYSCLYKLSIFCSSAVVSPPETETAIQSHESVINYDANDTVVVYPSSDENVPLATRLISSDNLTDVKPAPLIRLHNELSILRPLSPTVESARVDDNSTELQRYIFELVEKLDQKCTVPVSKVSSNEILIGEGSNSIEHLYTGNGEVMDVIPLIPRGRGRPKGSKAKLNYQQSLDGNVLPLLKRLRGRPAKRSTTVKRRRFVESSVLINDIDVPSTSAGIRFTDQVPPMPPLSFVWHSSVRRNFPCAQCPKTFASKQILQLHQRWTHKLNARHSCALCDKTFWLQTSLKRHVKTDHDDDDSSQRQKALPSNDAANANSEFASRTNCSTCFRTGAFLRQRTSVQHKELLDGLFQCPNCSRKY